MKVLKGNVVDVRVVDGKILWTATFESMRTKIMAVIVGFEFVAVDVIITVFIDIAVVIVIFEFVFVQYCCRYRLWCRSRSAGGGEYVVVKRVKWPR